MPDIVKISTYNICKGKNHKTIVANVLGLAAAGGNVICLQELRRIPGRRFIGSEIESALGEEWAAEYFLESGHFDLGLAIFWKKCDFGDYPEFERVPLPTKRRIHLNKKPFAIHHGIIERRALIATFRAGAKLMRVSNIHLDFQGGFEHRLNQMRFFVEYLKRQPTADYEMVCGDLNTFGTLAVSRLQREHIKRLLGGGFVSVLPDTSRTWQLSAADPLKRRMPFGEIWHNLGRTVRQRLDYVWVNGFDVLESRVVYVDGSDHFPITATLRAM